MRLTDEQRHAIVEETARTFGPGACVRLFGSRVDDNACGGDIDLYVEVGHALPNRAAAASRLAARLQLALGEQRIDIILVDPETKPQAIHAVARREGIAL
ncbi:MAG: nucleotidyltransferase domain-containing protein [Gammaproteobacteria bacterium]|nr:nucleotidyltransferase domain-containing protein [Gammaproteobacteria bacterium]